MAEWMAQALRKPNGRAYQVKEFLSTHHLVLDIPEICRIETEHQLATDFDWLLVNGNEVLGGYGDYHPHRPVYQAIKGGADEEA